MLLHQRLSEPPVWICCPYVDGFFQSCSSLASSGYRIGNLDQQTVHEPSYHTTDSNLHRLRLLFVDVNLFMPFFSVGQSIAGDIGG